MYVYSDFHIDVRPCDLDSAAQRTGGGQTHAQESRWVGPAIGGRRPSNRPCVGRPSRKGNIKLVAIAAASHPSRALRGNAERSSMRAGNEVGVRSGERGARGRAGERTSGREGARNGEGGRPGGRASGRACGRVRGWGGWGDGVQRRDCRAGGRAMVGGGSHADYALKMMTCMASTDAPYALSRMGVRWADQPI